MIRFRQSHEYGRRGGVAAIGLLLLIGVGHPANAQEALVDHQPALQADHGAMDEDWQNISTRALLAELTRLANALEDQKRQNEMLQSRMDRVTKRLDAMQSALEAKGTVLPPIAKGTGMTGQDVPALPAMDLSDMPAPASAPVATAPVPKVDIPNSRKVEGDESYWQWVTGKGKSAWRSVTDW
ncbi:hypothetical protein [uncultured Cohaesibacter sp.]|uniref:hypothetical protein n=1 Tax=uncultured Cohaesibacter sp. TaxID=1002546 RepID=UPI0029C71EF7|nr:hypothetical protein [uncultured Cohaesibacter sp.]